MPHKTLVTRSLDAKASQLQPQIKGRWGLIVLRDFKHDADLPPRQSFFLWKKNYWTYASMSKWTWPLGGEADDTFEKGCVTHSPQSGGMSHFRTLLYCLHPQDPQARTFLDCGWSVAVVPISKHHSVGFLPCMYSICGYVGIYANISVHIYKWYINIYYILYIYKDPYVCMQLM